MLAIIDHHDSVCLNANNKDFIMATIEIASHCSAHDFYEVYFASQANVGSLRLFGVSLLFACGIIVAIIVLAHILIILG